MQRSTVAWARALGLFIAGGALVAPDAAADSASAPDDARQEAYRKLIDRLDEFKVAGEVRTSEGLLLPELITIEIRSEVCVEHREPGARFWSLAYDTCFTYTAIDTVDEKGEYQVSVPCTDADATYESKNSFGELRLVQRGPVSFSAVSDAGWRHQETFASSRAQKRDLILTLEPETFYVVRAGAVFQERPRAESPEIRRYEFGATIPVIRFQGGWAQCLMGNRIGWMEMRFLGTEAQMKEKAPLQLKPAVDPIELDELRG
jgi:hypothetical protein